MKLETLLKNPEMFKTKLEFSSLSDCVTIVKQMLEQYPGIDSEQNPHDEVMYGDHDGMKPMFNAFLMKIGKEYIKRDMKIDHRELDDMIELSQDIGFEVVELKTGQGDYQGSNKYDTKTINIERKDDDFLPSLFYDNHIFLQLKGMIDNENVRASYLFVTKSWEQIKREMEDRSKPIHRNVLIGYVTRLIQLGYPPIFIPDERDFIDVIEHLFDKFYENPDETKMINRAIKVDGMDIIKFPNHGISDIIGERLVKHFGSIKNIVNANIEELQNIKGVGKKLSEKIYKLVNGGEQ